MKKVFLLGATGSIGESTLQVVKDYSNKLKIVGLSAHKNVEKLVEIGQNFNCSVNIITGLNNSNQPDISGYGYSDLLEAIKTSDADIVVNGIAGSDGLLPSVTTIESGKDLALANKETMVMAGPIINSLVDKYNVKLLPVDSEHSAIFHLLENCSINDIDEIILTASGGAFRDLPIDKLATVTVEDALKHPTWDMGVKITIDSASMANKGLEVIEAAKLFNLPKDKIKVLIHPQSYVHSLIRKKDLSMYAQISAPDMKLPIQNAILYPELEEVKSTFLDLSRKELTFDTPDMYKYPMLELSYVALEKGDAYSIAYNAANEILVEAFINKKITFLDISRITRIILESDITTNPDSINSVLIIDKEVRELTLKLIG